MNVTALRAELDKLERAGYGHCRVEAFPCMDVDEDTGEFDLDFVTTNYGVCGVHIPGPPSERFVSLLFDLSRAPGGPVMEPGNQDHGPAGGHPSHP